MEWEVEWFDGRGWGISATLDAWYAGKACAVQRRGFVGGWLLSR